MVEDINQDQEIAVLTEELGSDGHLIENVAARVASKIAEIRSQSQGILDASSKFSMDQFSSLKKILGEKAVIVEHAVRAGIQSSEIDWDKLKEAKDNLPTLRKVALGLKLPGDPLTLGEKINQILNPAPKKIAT